VILALTTNTAFEFTAFWWGKKTRAYHRHSRTAEMPRVNPKFGFRVTRSISIILRIVDAEKLRGLQSSDD
jgi:fatty-acid desaturase